MFKDENKSDHEGTRTLNFPIRSRTPYPLGHAASHMKTCKLFFALCSDSLVNLLKQKMKGFTRVSLEVNLICPEPFVDKQKYSEEVNYIEIEFPPKNREEI